MVLVATFFSHFGAVRFRKQCTAAGWPAVLMPVPRTLSSSCGTCVRYEIGVGSSGTDIAMTRTGKSLPGVVSDIFAPNGLQEKYVHKAMPADEPMKKSGNAAGSYMILPPDFAHDEVEKVVESTADGWKLLYKAEEV